jgi:hypothetical protein
VAEVVIAGSVSSSHRAKRRGKIEAEGRREYRDAFTQASAGLQKAGAEASQVAQAHSFRRRHRAPARQRQRRSTPVENFLPV